LIVPVQVQLDLVRIDIHIAGQDRDHLHPQVLEQLRRDVGPIVYQDDAEAIPCRPG